MVKDACFNTKSPIIIGVTVIEGVLKIGTPICVPDKENLKLGIVTSIELNKKPIT
jgi:translation initiation factor IF-2